MNRRNFILLSSIGVGMVAIPPSLYFLSPKTKEYAINLIKAELSYLKLEPVGLNNYIDDYFKNTSNDIMSNIRWKIFYYLNFDSNKSNIINDLLKNYLLSSDFFLNQMDVSKTVNYLGMFNPYTSPIPNPYSYILLKST